VLCTNFTLDQETWKENRAIVIHELGDDKLTYAANDIWGKHALGYFPANNFEATYQAHKAHNHLSKIQTIEEFQGHLIEKAQLAFLNNGSIYINTYSN